MAPSPGCSAASSLRLVHLRALVSHLGYETFAIDNVASVDLVPRGILFKGSLRPARRSHRSASVATTIAHSPSWYSLSYETHRAHLLLRYSVVVRMWPCSAPLVHASLFLGHFSSRTIIYPPLTIAVVSVALRGSRTVFQRSCGVENRGGRASQNQVVKRFSDVTDETDRSVIGFIRRTPGRC